MAQLPLHGKRFLVTRTREQARAFIALLEEEGGEAICVPTIEIAPPLNWGPLDYEVRELENVDILILTSTNGVASFFDRLFENEQYIGLLRDISVVAVGPKTAQALKDYAVTADIVPVNHSAEGIIEELLKRDISGKKILYPRAELARPYLADQLRQAGAEVADPVAYRTLSPDDNAAEVRRLLQGGEVDAICFSSSSTFDNLVAMLGDDLRQLLGETRLFSIGPLTSKTIREHGYTVDLEPTAWTLDALVEAMVAYYA